MEYLTLTDLASLFAAYGSGPLLSHTRTLVVLVKPDGTLLEWNPAFGKLKGFAPAATMLRDLLSSPSRPLFGKLLQGQNAGRGTLELLTGKEHELFECILIPVPDGNFLLLAERLPEAGQVERSRPAKGSASKAQADQVAKLTRDLKETRRALHIKQTGLESVLAQADEIAHTDQLTFLSNQRKIVGDLQDRVARSNHSRKPFTIFMLDIDRFKPINDTYGHIVGDQVLRRLAGELRGGIRQSDTIGRYGGEEFLILLPGTGLESAIPMAERLLQLARAMAIDVDGQVVRLTVSIGIAQYNKGENWKDFLKRADKAMYQSKNSGRDRWSVSTL
jgi:diguanylate cyclase